jgi:ubiquinone/menaquinone biosynthesis C-methylase UbiE
VTELRKTFDGVADLYDRVRPTYPEPLFDELFSRLPKSPNVLEVGPGTGQATVSLLARDARVTAVELGVNMASRLRRKFDNEDQLKIVVSSFEDVLVTSHSFDLVVAATAYHWVEESVRLEKPIDILRPEGWLAIIDTVNISSPSDAGFSDRSQFIYDKYGDGSDEPRQPLAHEVTGFLFDALEKSPLYATPLRFRYPWDQTNDAERFGDLLRSYSSTQAMPEAEREAFVGEMIGLVNNEFAGHVTQPIVIVLTMAQPAGKFS